jgi:hypothetical protein
VSEVKISEEVARAGVECVTFEAVVTRADGTVEDLGVVAYWHRNRLRRWWFAVRMKIGGAR